jgi:hypothetical protein
MLNANIRKARPPLIIVSPLSFWLCIGYVGLNLALGYVVYSVPDTSGLALYRLFSQHFIGAAFALNALVLLFTLVINAWRGIRFMLGTGLFIKAMYAYSLIALGIKVGFENINGIMAIWLFITWVQFCLIVFFAPPLLNGHVKGGAHGTAK